MSIKRAFTLIELLIVVAIIAILAAIAVPNFLEAQVRSKVSRTKADMRTTATALEAYKVDTNRYPPDFSVYWIDRVPRKAHLQTFVGRLRYLTTPVAYISAIPVDDFAITLAKNANMAGSVAYREGASSSGAIINPITYDYAQLDRDLAPQTQGLDDPNNWARFTSNTGTVAWGLNSVGPDVTDHRFLGAPGITVYDPSNGSISLGQIIRTNLGADDIGTNNN
jgi:prepilin-type N-terminal cleavage/methylation domain-containing protein